MTAARIAGPGVSDSGSGDYAVTGADIANLPAGIDTSITDVLAQMPGVAIDQNQQIHIRNTEGPQFQYQINGALVPLDINTNPPFVSMLNPMFVTRLDLLDGVLPARYSYATGGIVDIQTRDGCDGPGGSATLLAGQSGTLQPSGDYAGLQRRHVSYYASALYSQNDTAFSSATPGPTPVHDRANQGQTFDMLSYAARCPIPDLGVIVSAAVSNNQLPNVPGPRAPICAGKCAGDLLVANQLRSRFPRLSGHADPQRRAERVFSYHLSYAAHAISEEFVPDNVGELIYQGVASAASHQDIDHTLQGDVTHNSRHAHTRRRFLFRRIPCPRRRPFSRVRGVDARESPFPADPGPLSTTRMRRTSSLAFMSTICGRSGRRLRLNIGTALRYAHRLFARQPDRSDSQSGVHAGYRHNFPRRCRTLFSGAGLSGHLARRARGVCGNDGCRAARDCDARHGGRHRIRCGILPSPSAGTDRSRKTLSTRSRTIISIPDNSAWCRFLRRSTTITASSGEASLRSPGGATTLPPMAI